ncbi:MAG: hypothetical protein AAGK14_11635, partial [Verrucomicrobiota bacterium]
EFCHWFMLILFVGWTAFFLFILWRFHNSRQPKADHDGMKSHFSSHLEVAVVIVEAVLLVGFAVPIWYQAVDQFPPEKESLVVRAVAEQYGWNFHYAGEDGRFGRGRPELVDGANPLGLTPEDPFGLDDVVVKNQMHVPVGQAVIVKITSKDVIHNYALPAMRVSQDAIPGMEIPLWFKAAQTSPTDELGMAVPYEIICGQLCGGGHGLMRATLYVDDGAAYDAWYQGQAKQLAGAVAEKTASTR